MSLLTCRVSSENISIVLLGFTYFLTYLHCGASFFCYFFQNSESLLFEILIIVYPGEDLFGDLELRLSGWPSLFLPRFVKFSAINFFKHSFCLIFPSSSSVMWILFLRWCPQSLRLSSPFSF